MSASIPEPLRDLFDEPALGQVSYLNDGGQFVTFPYLRRRRSGSLGGRPGWRP